MRYRIFLDLRPIISRLFYLRWNILECGDRTSILYYAACNVLCVCAVCSTCIYSMSSKRSVCVQYVQQVKNAVKQLFLSGGGGATSSTLSVTSSQSATAVDTRVLPAPLCTDEQKVSLAQAIYKLHFQLLQLFETYIKLVSTLQQCFRPPQVSYIRSPHVSYIRPSQDAGKFCCKSDHYWLVTSDLNRTQA